MTLHADRVVAAAESYIGLVEFGVGVIPGGGGSKEMALRASDSFAQDDVELNRFREYFLTMAMAKVSTSAYEAFDLDISEARKGYCSCKPITSNCDRQSCCKTNGRPRLYETCETNRC